MARSEGQQRDEATVVVASRYGTVTALRAENGVVLWQQSPGGRVHGLAQADGRVYASWVIPKATGWIEEGPEPPPPDEWHLRRRLAAAPVRLAALRAEDGMVVWQREGWASTGGALMLDGRLVVAEAPVEEIGRASVSARDEATGDARWHYETGVPWGRQVRLLAARGGRVYLRGERHPPDARGIEVVDTVTGREVWRYERDDTTMVLSDGGKLVGFTAWDAATQHHVWTILTAADGSMVATLPSNARLVALSDEGVAYVVSEITGSTTGPYRRPLLQALRIADGHELWRADGVGAESLSVVGDVLYYANLSPHPRRRAEVGALDAGTGRSLWRWRSPVHYATLLKLWGWRTPRVLLWALAQARRNRAHAREHHERIFLRHELLHGRWRHPGALEEMRMVVGVDALYVATNLGLFALRARDGRLLWHALPTSELVSIAVASARK